MYAYDIHLVIEIQCNSMKSILYLAATKQLCEWFSPPVHPSVCRSHLFDYVSISVSSKKFEELLLMTEMMSMQKIEVRGPRGQNPI